MLDFPEAPTVDQVYSAAGKNWAWDGEKWNVAVIGQTGDDVLLVNTTVFLPAGFSGMARVENTTGAAIVVTMPPTPYPGQSVLIKDTVGNASTYLITVSGGGASIEGQSTMTIVYNYGWLDLIYTGFQWVQT